ncbi:MAG: DegV family protein [Lachnospiraceae bacterium]|nr:DegV family protein [Lachnospiraceae bacterium]
MNKIIITTESCSDLTEEMIAEHGVYIIPMHIVFETETFADGTIPVQYIYNYFKKTKHVPKTSAVNPSEFTAFFEEIAKENPGSSIIHIGYSSECSCTYQNAVIGIEDCKSASVHLIDSKNVSGGAGNLTMLAVKLRDENPLATAEELAEKIKSYVPRIVTGFVPDRLEYLVAGGRVSNAAAIGASILRIKPRIDIVDGKLIATKKYRGSMARVAYRFAEEFVQSRELNREVIYIMYAIGADEDVIENMKKYFIGQGFKKVVILHTGCVMSTHGGEGAIGISGFASV